MSVRRRFLRTSLKSGKQDSLTKLRAYMDRLEAQGVRFEKAEKNTEAPRIMLSPEQSEALEEVMQMDRDWFHAHPGETEYERPARLADFDEVNQKEFRERNIDPGRTHLVRVTQLEPGQRIRFIHPREQPLPGEEWMQDLLAKGCGAYVGSQACNAKAVPVLMLVNQPFAFLLYRVGWRKDGTCAVCLCERHQGSVGAATQDFDEGLRKQEEAECRKFYKKGGITPPDPGFVGAYDLFSGEYIRAA